MRSALPRSLRGRLLAALLSAVLAVGVASSLLAYRNARAEIDALLDEELRQVALSLRDYSALDLTLLGPPRVEPEHRVLIQVWDWRGAALYLSDTTQALPLAARPGFVEIRARGARWRAFVLPAGAQTIQVAQPDALRRELAAGVALRILLPVLLLVPVLAGVIGATVRLALAPVERVARALAQRSPTALEPLPVSGLPSEVQPLIDALNDLLVRLRQAFEVQRRFAQDAAHELRTPLAAVALQAHQAETAGTEAERREALAALRGGVRRAGRVAAQLLTLARLDPEAVTGIDARIALRPLAERVAADLQPLTAARGAEIAVQAEDLAVSGSEDALYSAIANVVDNALRHGVPGPLPAAVEDGAAVALGAARAAGAAIEPTGPTELPRVTIALDVFRQQQTAVIRVTDAGPGIAAAERERAFERFARGARPAADGAGLGLAIVRQTALLHRGTVTLADGPGGRGLAVEIRLPLTP